MAKKNMRIIFVVTAVVIGGLVIWGMKQPQNVENENLEQVEEGSSGIVYYYGRECSHCKNIEKMLTDNKIAERVTFVKKEVWHNTANNSELQEKSKECALGSDAVGVPFVWARGKCFIGEVEVEEFFKKEAGIQ